MVAMVTPADLLVKMASATAIRQPGTSRTLLVKSSTTAADSFAISAEDKLELELERELWDVRVEESSPVSPSMLPPGR